jgi:hypothetical protein
LASSRWEKSRECAADAAFYRAVQLKVAISRWLRFNQKEGLYQEEKITARISGRSKLIKESEAKNYNSLCTAQHTWNSKLLLFSR